MINMEMIEITSPALVVGLLIALTHGLLGIKVLEKGIVFIDLAIAQIAGLGLVIAGIFLPEYGWFYQFIALLFAISASIFFYYIEKIAPDIQEAVIGSSFVLAASLSVLFLSNHSHGSDEIKHLLSGQILFVTFQDILQHLPIYIGVIGLWFLKPKMRNGLGFYLIFSFAITSSVQLVGIYVVFASLILPAIASRGQKNPLLISWVCGVAAVILGVIFATIFDLPAGVLMVIFYFVVTCLILVYNLYVKTK
ncbi:MAG: zinc/manganese transport system permease protein [Rickettsiales bacterium]|jgi:zinc/manganese transport system permease protein